MKDDNKQSQRQEKYAKWRKFAKKRWIYPAVYLGFAALVVASVLWMQGGNEEDYSIDNPQNDNQNENSIVYDDRQEAVPVGNAQEKFQWPVAKKDAVNVTKQFYDVDDSPEEQQAALVYYNNTYYTNKGINLASESGKSFAVTAAMSGTVVQAEEDSLVGHVVKIDHGDGVVTLYQSLKSLAVEKGDKVEQGDKLGMAGRNTYNKNAGVHLHFEIRKNGEELNPQKYLGQTMADLPKTNSQETSESGTETDNNDSNNGSMEDSKENEKQDKDTAGQQPAAEDNKSDQKDQKDQEDAKNKEDGAA